MSSDASMLSSPRRAADRWDIAVWALFGALGGVYTLLAMWRYLVRGGEDDGTFTQVVNGLTSGFSSTVEGGANHLLVHASPILIVGFPFVEAFHGAVGLLVLQAFATAAVIFPVWGMASARFSKPVAFLVTAVAACYPPLSGEGSGDFHELAFAPALAAGLAWAIDRRRWRWAIAAALALVCVKEDMFVGLAFIGAVIGLTSRGDRERRRCGWWIAGIAVGAAFAYFGVVRRLIDPNFPYWSLHYYQWWRQPPTISGYVAWNSPERLQYLVSALAPLAFLPVASRYVLFAVPGLAEVLLSHEGVTFIIGEHYSATWSGYLLCAYVDGLFWLSARSALAARLALGAAFCVSLWTTAFASPTYPAYALYRRPTAADYARDRLFESLPATASIWSDPFLFGHLGMFPKASIYRQGQDYLIFDRVTDADQWRSGAVQGLVESGRYRVFEDADGVVILKESLARTIGR